ncbi:vWA domain-containing protein [Filimonas effusa]|uniref:VWA domain-containing protein n=1 Tax=Filimonas effusa TaxID=2508721 RepID=A0A4Q1DCU4_9BACT|nr:VWA domain-containing protein [Filimonas effusa]RXK87297.1 VWA domain-containing protein [Filimonas effusa]
MHDYISFEQIAFGSDNFADNPEPRCPCVLLLDTSGSMEGAPIWQLNQGIQTFKEELENDPLAAKRVEVAVVTFGPVQVASDFVTVSNFFPRQLHTTGDTPMGEAITLAIDMVKRRKQTYKDNGVAYYKPWIVLITDGAPTDYYDKAAALVREGEAGKSFAFFAIGVENANMNILSEISVRTPQKLRGLMFREFFLWLSGSMKQVSGKSPGECNTLLPPTGWTAL